MTSFYNKANGVEFSDLDSETSNIDPGPGNGPWTHSTDSYSRKVTSPNERGSTLSKRDLCIIGAVGAVIFVVAFVLGIVVGTFAIKRDAQNQDLEMTERLRRSTTQVQTTPTIPCECSTSIPSITESATTVPNTACEYCSTRNPDESSGQEYITSPFAALTKQEINKVYDVMVNRGNTTRGNNYITENRVSHIYLFPTSKSNVLAYLDNNGVFRGRFAKVHVFRGAVDPPDVMEYKVGPLHVAEDQIKIEPLTQDGEIDYNIRPYDVPESQALHFVTAPHFRAMRTLLKESFDGKSYGSGIYSSFAFLPSHNRSSRVSTAYMYLRMGGISTLRIIPITCRVYHPGTDHTTWRVYDFYYLSQGPFNTGQELQDAYDSGNLRKVIFPTGYFTSHYNEFKLVRNESLPNRAFANLPPPRTYEPGGPRYTVEGSRISWMDWEFDFTSDSIRGPAVFDVRFKGNRIAYEISLQDVTLMYASQSNGAGPPVLSDTLFHLGKSNPPQLGLDCPERATLIRLAMLIFSKMEEKNHACVFEADDQDSMWKYRTYGMASSYLVVRSLMNMGNYEYSVEWKFHMDGSVETLTSASGYLFGAFWDATDPLVNADKSSTPFGYRLAEYMLGPIHDHSYVFKVDIDILGQENSLELLHWKAGDVLDALQTQTNTTEVPGYFPFNTTRYIQYELLEKEAGFIIDPVNPKYFNVVNEKERNYWGNKRGYRIIPHSVGAENFKNHVMLGPWNHLKYNLAVSKRKDIEPYATNSIYDIHQPSEPFVSFADMLDNETIRNEDLVFWVTEKFFHAPSAEDLPMTLKVKSGFTLKPYNYFDRTPVFDMPAHYDNVAGNPYTVESCVVQR